MFRRQDGIMLLEVVIATAILLVCLPAVFSAYLSMQRRQTDAAAALNSEAEFQYLESFLRSDLRSVTGVVSVQTDSISFSNLALETVVYSFKDGQFKRQVGSSIVNLNSLLKISAFAVERAHPGLVAFDLTIASRNRQIAVFLPDETH